MADVKNTLSLELQVKYDQAMKALGEVRTAIAAVTQGTPANATGGDLGGMQKALVELKTSIAEVKTAIAGLSQSTAAVGSTSSGIDQTARSLDNVADSAGEAKRRTDDAGDSARRLARDLAEVGATVLLVRQVAIAIRDISAELLRAQGRLDNFQAGVQFALGREAGNDLDYTREKAGELGLELTSLSRSYVQFMASARGTALEGARARDVFESIAQASSVLGLSAERQEGVFRALSQMMSKGIVQQEELRGQLGDQLPGAFRIAAAAMGVTESKLSSLIERGEVLTNDFLPKLSSHLKNDLGDTAVTAADGAQQSINRFASAWERLKQNVSESGVGDAIKGQLNILSDAFDDISRSMEGARKSGEGFWGQMTEGYQAYLRFLDPRQAFRYEAQNPQARMERLGQNISENSAEADRLERGGGLYQRSDAAQLRRQVVEDAAELQKLIAAAGTPDQGLWGDDRRMQALADLAVQRRRLEGEIGGEITKNLSNIEKAEKNLADFRQKYALLQGTAEYGKLEAELTRKLAEARETASRKGLAQPIPSARRVFDTEAELALDAARREERALQESYGVRLTDLQTYLERRRQIADAALSAETARQQANIDAQRELLKKLDAITPKTDVQAQTIADRRADAQRTIEQAQAQQIKAQRDRDDIERQLNLIAASGRLADADRARTLEAEKYREKQNDIRRAVDLRYMSEWDGQNALAELNRTTAQGLREQAASYDELAKVSGTMGEAAASAARRLREEAKDLEATMTSVEKRFEGTAKTIDAAFQKGFADIFDGIGEKGISVAETLRSAFVGVAKSVKRAWAEIAAEDLLRGLNDSLGAGEDGKPNTIGRVLTRAIGGGPDGSSPQRAIWMRNADASGAGAAGGAQGILPGDVKGTPGIGDVLGDIGTQLKDLFGGWMDTLGSLFSEITGGFSGLFDGLLSSLGSVFSSGGGGGGGFFEAIGSFFGSFFHQGGVVGAGASRGRMVDPRVWIGAPRFHSGGIAGNEVAAILKKGEEVLTEDDPRHAKNGGGGGMGVKVELINQGTPQRATGSQARFDGRQMVVQVFTEDIAENGPMSRAIQDTLGGNRAAGLT